MANKVYQHDETTLVWTSSGGDYAFTCTSLATVTGRQGAMADLGTAARSARYAWRAYVQFSTTPIVGEVVYVYIKTGSGATAGTRPDNDDGTGDIAVSSIDKLKNLQMLGPIVVDEAATGVEMVRAGEIWLPHRWVAPVFWNATVDTLSATGTTIGFELTPIPLEVQ